MKINIHTNCAARSKGKLMNIVEIFQWIFHRVLDRENTQLTHDIIYLSLNRKQNNENKIEFDNNEIDKNPLL